MSGSRKVAHPAPYYDGGDVVLYHGDCREIMPALNLTPECTVAITDPPYGDTSLEWDRWVSGWAGLMPVRQAWVFGSLRMWLLNARDEMLAAGFRLAQDVIEEDIDDIVWEKHNGSSFHADRFRRVHELAVHWYKGDWSDHHHHPVVTMDARARTVRRKERPTHTGEIAESTYTSEDGGPRLMRSVIKVRSEHGRAVHPTQKPIGILTPLIEYSVHPNNIVLDPFAGSASTLIAARMTGRRAIGIEGREDYLEKAVERLAQQSLFAGGAAS